MHLIDNSNEHITKMPEVKLILWIVYDVTWAGMGVVSFLNTIWLNVNEAEKIIIFLLFVIMGVYRIINLHHETEKKRLDNQQKKIEIDKLKNGNRRVKK